MRGGERGRPLLLMAAGATLISFSAVFVSIADVSAEVSAFYRMFFGSVIMLGWLMIRHQPVRLSRRIWWVLALAGVFFTVDLTCWHASILIVGPGLGTLLANFQVFIMPLAGLWLFAESLHLRFFTGAALAMLGLWFQVGVGWSGFSDQYQLGIVLGLITAVAYAGYMISLRKAQAMEQQRKPFENLAIASVVCTIILALQLLAKDQSFAIPDTRSLLVLLAYGILCQVVGWLLITSAMPRLKAMTVGLMLLLQPTLSFTWDILFFGRSLTALEAVGVLLTLVGIYFGVTNRRADRPQLEASS
ncbi:MAG: DMT family transporter [Sedimenticola sp.]